jgi:hypothetical protein
MNRAFEDGLLRNSEYDGVAADPFSRGRCGIFEMVDEVGRRKA